MYKRQGADVDTPAGPRYTRNGHLSRTIEGQLITADGAVVRGVDGPITVGEGSLTVDSDGSVMSNGAVVGKLAIVQFGDPGALVRESGALLKTDETPTPVATPTIRTGSLEQSNVSVVDRVAELTAVNRSFQALQKAVSVLMNDVERAAGGAEAAGREVARGGDDARAKAHFEAGRRIARRGRGAGHAGVLVEEVLELDVALLVAGRVDVGQVVRDVVDAGLLGVHAARGGIQGANHNDSSELLAAAERLDGAAIDIVHQHTRVPGAATTTGDSPTGLEVGLGTRVVATSRDFTTGSFRATGSPLDIAIQGDGFFQINMPDGTTAFTRAGALHRDGQGLVVTADGYALEPQISIPENATSISITRDGVVSATIPGQSAAQQLGVIELATFQNPSGLTPMGGNLFQVTSASGEPQTGPAGTEQRGSLQQGYLEDSNVSVVEEMVNMILGQRAYEASSKVIKAADEMLAQVNNIVR